MGKAVEGVVGGVGKVCEDVGNAAKGLGLAAVLGAAAVDSKIKGDMDKAGKFVGDAANGVGAGLLYSGYQLSKALPGARARAAFRSPPLPARLAAIQHDER